MAAGRVLIAGIGNVFCGDDGFGSTVAQRLGDEELPAGVEVADYGIRGIHLAYQLLEGYDLLVLVDAVQRGEGPPGTVYVIEPDLSGETSPSPLMDAHDMSPDAVLALLPRLGGGIEHVVVVGCEPATAEPGMGLSDPVERAVEEASRVVRDIVVRDIGRSTCASA